VKYKRSIKNYLIDSRFQLKYTSYIVIIALLISGAIGSVLYKTSQELVGASAKVVEESNKVVEENRKVSDVVRMNITKDPIYNDNPELKDSIAAETTKSDKQIEEQQAQLVRQQAQLLAGQRTMLLSLVGSLGIMVVLLGLLGIFVTHKVAGPIYKMKMLLRQVGEGKLKFEGRLRKGDELQDFFESFATMVERLRERQAMEVENLEKAMELAKKAGANEESIGKFAKVRDKMKSQLDI
jgi:nitrogen fixation/metabolism regulation signal transduction histidine kinase